jgi:hypothetical protein
MLVKCAKHYTDERYKKINATLKAFFQCRFTQKEAY